MTESRPGSTRVRRPAAVHEARTRPTAPRGEAPSPSAHPRIRARRVEIARDDRRRRRRRLTGFLAVVCALVWSGVVLRSSLLDVDRVQVSGATRTAPAAIRSAAGVDPGAAMIQIEREDAARRVEALPWVSDAHVTRMWPGTLRITVRERRPLGVVAVPGGWALLDRTGRVLTLTSVRPGDLVVLRGTRTVEPATTVGPRDRRILRTLDRLPADLAHDIERAWAGPDGLEVGLSDGFRIVLGDAADLDDKAASTAAVRASADQEADGCRIDVRVPTAPVLTRGRGCA